MLVAQSREVGCGICDEVADDLGMPLVQRRRLAGCCELFGRITARALEQEEAIGRVGAAVHQRLVDQRPERFEGLGRVERRFSGVDVGRDLLRHRCGEPAKERFEPAEHGFFGVRQQRVAPIEGAAQRVMAGRTLARIGAQAQALAELCMHPAQAEDRDARRGHLDRERQSIELTAQIDGGAEIAFVKQEAAICR